MWGELSSEWGELSSGGGASCLGASFLWGELPWGELSLGRVVRNPSTRMIDMSRSKSPEVNIYIDTGFKKMAAFDEKKYFV